MWIEGIQPRVHPENVNEQIAKLEGFLEEKDAQFWIYKFLKANPSMAAFILMGVRLLPFQQLLIKGMLQNDYTLAILSRSGGKCERWDNPIWTDKGLKKIIDVEVGDFVQSLNGRNRVLCKTVNPSQTTYRVETSHGFVSEGLDYHRVLKLNPETLEYDWTHSKDIQVGDYLVMRKGDNFWPEQENILSSYKYPAKDNPNKSKDINLKGACLKDWYYFFGLLLGDGHRHRATVGITSEAPEVLSFCEQFFNDIGLDFRYQQNPGNKSKTVICSSVQLAGFLDHLGFERKLAHEKTIPARVLKCSKENAKELLMGLMDTDGSSNISLNDNKTRLRLEFSSSSYGLIKQVRNLFLNFDIVTSSRQSFKGGEMKFPNGQICNCKPAWRIDISGANVVRKFYEEIGFKISYKQDKVKYLAQSKLDGFQKDDTVPFVGEYLKKKYGKKTLCADLVKGTPHYNHKLVLRANTPRDWFKRVKEFGDLLDENDWSVLDKFLDERVFFSQVKSISTSENVTVDIQVETEECYVSDGLVSHNTWLTGVFVGLYAMLNPGVHIGIISATFRQSKEVMKKLITISKSPKAKFLAECMNVKFAPDEWNIEIGTSKITALPLGDGQRLRGFRFQMMVIDELLLMPQSVIDEVITPFLAGVTNPVERKKLKEVEDKLIAKGLMEEKDRKQWPANKMIGLSSASYKFEYLYRLYQSYEESIRGVVNGNTEEQEEEKKQFNDARKFIAHISYDALPKELFDEKVVKKSKNEMSVSQFNREYNAEFTSDSAGYYKISKLKECRYEPGAGQDIELVGEKGAEYILAVDPNAAGNEDSDDFAMQLFKIIDKDAGKVCLVHSYAVAGADLKDHAAYFTYLINNFNIVFIAFDNAGGPTTLQFWNEHPEIKKLGYQFKVLDIPFNDQTLYQEELSALKKEYNSTDKKICLFRVFDLPWQRVANELLQANVDHKRIRFAGSVSDETYRGEVPASIPIDDLLYQSEAATKEKSFGRARYVDFADNVADLITRTIEQCALIEISTTDTGQQRFVLPANLRKQRGVNKSRRDSFSALFLGNWAAKIYMDMTKAEGGDEVDYCEPGIF